MRDEDCFGTIYRIAPKGFKPDILELDLSTVDGQIEALRSPANNVRYLGYRALAKQADELVDLLGAETIFNGNLYEGIRALWLLGHSAVGRERLKESIKMDEHPSLSLVALRALLQHGEDPVALAEISVGQSSIAVKREALLGLRDVPLAKKQEVLLKLIQSYDGEDRWYLEAIGTASEGVEAEVWSALKVGDAMSWDAPTSGLAWRLHPAALVPAFKARAMSASLSVEERKRMIDALAFVPAREAAEAMVVLGNKGPEDQRAYATWWGRNRQNNDWQEFNLGASYTLPLPVATKSKKAKSRTVKVPAWAKRVYQSDVVKFDDLISIDVDITGASKLYLVVQDSGDGKNSDWADWVEPALIGPEGAIKLVSLPWMSAGSEWGEVGKNKNVGGSKLVTAAGPAKHGIGTHAHSVIVYHIAGKGFTRFASRGGVDVKKKSAASSVVFEVYVEGGDSTGGIEVEKVLSAKGDPAKGAKLFAGRATCLACHKHGKLGNDIGPDLTQIGTKFDKKVILESMMNPSAEIAFGYETWEVKRKDGSSVTGFLVADADPVQLKDPAGQTHVIAVKDIASRTQFKQSIMPPVSAYGLSSQQLADLIAFSYRY